MAPTIENQESQETAHQPFLASIPTTKPPKTKAQRAVRKTFKGTAHLANLLPTGTVLVFQILSPVFTNRGQCPTSVNQHITLVLLGFCSLFSFLLCFTDSVRDQRGKVRYGLATFNGLWVVDSSVTLAAEEAAKYRLKFLDFFHAIASVMVFTAVALFDQNVVKCFYPTPSEETKELLIALPVGVSVVCSWMFVRFPTKRHGIGFPLSPE
ncbi:protein DMP7 [Ziziphus jujuba]|uniref:Protein DMP7 n=2 Tax=Ziziphus jujuba TaxID=326968 RepID=A0A6P3ZQ28_ZIZJJ|nr:protein DMP7 [Ziziphus jujuba]KAH7533142.1 hypothetical protein FEM48_Zijuj04G0099000 [Ziziphus jujuba var. spinosa]